MEKIIEQITSWKFLQDIPENICGFKLIKELVTCGFQYRIFTYHNQERRRSFSIMYDKATKDFLARIVIGLTEYCDISFIATDLATIEKVLVERMDRTIGSLANFSSDSLCYRFTSQKIIEWTYGLGLPKNLSGFEIYIHPGEPIKVLNGSYIILDYSDFATESNFIVYYNIYRDEYFSEIRLRRTPMMTANFDAKTLPQLEERLETNLASTLENLRLKLQR